MRIEGDENNSITLTPHSWADEMLIRGILKTLTNGGKLTTVTSSNISSFKIPAAECVSEGLREMTEQLGENR